MLDLQVLHKRDVVLVQIEDFISQDEVVNLANSSRDARDVILGRLLALVLCCSQGTNVSTRSCVGGVCYEIRRSAAQLQQYTHKRLGTWSVDLCLGVGAVSHTFALQALSYSFSAISAPFRSMAWRTL